MLENLVTSLPLFLSLITACSAGFIILSYENLAAQNSWPIGRLYKSDVFRLVGGGLSIIGSVIFSLVAISLLYAVLVLIIGFFLGFFLSFIWKTNVQWLGVLLLVGSWIFQFFI